MSKGKFIAFEGLDGSGKSTQAALLVQAIQKTGREIFQFDFPQYGRKSAGLVENYLAGKYGGEKEVDPKIASIFFACDRYDGSFQIKKALEEGKTLIVDRYTASNAGHQGGKIKDIKKRKIFLKWLYQLEYEIFKIPKPTISFILKTSPELAFKSAKNKQGAKKTKILSAFRNFSQGDIHERDLDHLKRSFDSYLFLQEEYPKDYIMIECLNENGEFLSPNVIHKEIMKKIKNIL